MFHFQISAKLLARPEPQCKETPPEPSPEEKECDASLVLLKIKLMKLNPRIREEIIERMLQIASEALRHQEAANIPQFGNFPGPSSFSRQQCQSSVGFGSNQQQMYKRYATQSEMGSTIYPSQETQVNTFTTIDEEAVAKFVRSLPTITAVTTMTSSTCSSSPTFSASNLEKNT